MITDLPYIPTNYSYPQSIHNCPVGIDHVDTSCSKNGFTEWEIEEANGSSLPPGMTSIITMDLFMVFDYQV